MLSINSLLIFLFFNYYDLLSGAGDYYRYSKDGLTLLGNTAMEKSSGPIMLSFMPGMGFNNRKFQIDVQLTTEGKDCKEGLLICYMPLGNEKNRITDKLKMENVPTQKAQMMRRSGCEEKQHGLLFKYIDNKFTIETSFDTNKYEIETATNNRKFKIVMGGENLETHIIKPDSTELDDIGSVPTDIGSGALLTDKKLSMLYIDFVPLWVKKEYIFFTMRGGGENCAINAKFDTSKESGLQSCHLGEELIDSHFNVGEGVEEYELKIKVNSQNWFEIQSGERWGERLNQSETIDDQAVGPKWELKAAEFAGLSTLTDTKDRHKWGTERLEESQLLHTEGAEGIKLADLAPEKMSKHQLKPSYRLQLFQTFFHCNGKKYATTQSRTVVGACTDKENCAKNEEKPKKKTKKRSKKRISDHLEN